MPPSLVALLLLAAAPEAPRVDALGDPLPAGAIARFGSPRLRFPGGLPVLAFSPSGAAVAFGSTGAALHLARVPDGKPLATLEPKFDPRLMAFTPDGLTLVLADAELLVRYDVQSGRELSRLKTEETGWLPRAVTPDAKWATHLAGETLRVVDVASGKTAWELPLPRDSSAVDLAVDGATVYVGGYEGELRALGAHAWTARDDKGGKTGLLAVSPAGDRVLSVSGPRLWVRDARTGAPVAGPRDLGGDVFAAAWRPDGKVLAVAPPSSTEVALLDPATLAEVARAHVADACCVLALAWTRNGEVLGTASGDGRIRFWDGERLAALPAPKSHAGDVWSVAFTPDGRVVSSDGAGPARVWDVATGKVVRELPAGPRTHGVAVAGPLIAVQGDGIALFGEKGKPRVLEADMPVSEVAFSPDGKLLAIAEATTVAFVRPDGKVAGKVRVAELKGRTLLDIERLAFASPRALWVALDDGTARLFDVATRVETSRIALPWDAEGGTSIHGLAVSPDGKRVALGWSEEGVLLYANGKRARTLKEASALTYGVAFSPDGRSVAAGGRDGKVRVWDADTGALVSTFVGHDGTVNSVAFSRDGALLASGGVDSTVLVWKLR